jgi:hypothetical protein
MQRDNALRIASTATQADTRLMRHEHQLAASLMSLLPDDIVTAAPSPRDDSLGVWAIAGNSLYEVDIGEYFVPPANDPATEITCRTRTIDPMEARVTVSERVGQPPGGAIIRNRRWEFVLAAGEDAIIIETEQAMRGGFQADQVAPADELLARALARAGGFAVPDDDVGQGEY